MYCRFWVVFFILLIKYNILWILFVKQFTSNYRGSNLDFESDGLNLNLYLNLIAGVLELVAWIRWFVWSWFIFELDCLCVWTCCLSPVIYLILDLFLNLIACVLELVASREIWDLWSTTLYGFLAIWDFWSISELWRPFL